jgi:hypothetical protein
MDKIPGTCTLKIEVNLPDGAGSRVSTDINAELLHADQHEQLIAHIEQSLVYLRNMLEGYTGFNVKAVARHQ